MKLLRYFLYVVSGFVVLVGGLVVFAALQPDRPATSGLLQTFTFDGKTVHIVRSGPGPISYQASARDGALFINGERLELTGASVFTVAVDTNGKHELRMGGAR